MEVVVYDSCVLYPYTLRDTLISLTKIGKFQARWTNKITQEWTSNLLKNVPGIQEERIRRTCDLMVQAVPDAVIEGYERIIDDLVLPDPDDRHVLAAAIHAEARKIITENARDFPVGILSAWEIEACRPDAFVSGLLRGHPLAVFEELKKQRLRLKNPALTVEEFLESLAKAGLPVAASLLREHSNLL